ncbi:MAG TPA: hypothetical protein VM163_10640 [bacterium]|nr:hypothetical protein [bacterium]
MIRANYTTLLFKLRILASFAAALCLLGLVSGAVAASIELTVLDDSGPVSAGDALGAVFVEHSFAFKDPPGEIETDQNGKLTFSGLGAETYFVRVKHVGVQPVVVKFKHHIVVGSGETANETISFRSGGDLKIQVRSQAGSVPTGDIDVYLYDQVSSTLVGQTRCDGLGEAHYDNVAPGIYFARVRHWSMRTDAGFHTFDIVVQPLSNQTRRVKIPLCSSLIFTVSDSFGRAPSNSATVSLSRQSAPFSEVVASRQCDASGRVDFGEVVAGDYKAKLVYTRGLVHLERYYFTLAAPADGSASLPILLDEVARLKCLVKDAAGTPVIDDGVKLALIHDASFDVIAEDRSPGAGGLVDFGYVPAGSVSVRIENSLVDPPKTWFLVGQTLEPGETKTLQTTVERGCGLSLTVRYDGENVPASSATAFVFNQDTGEAVASALAHEGGLCSYESLVPGTYSVQVFFAPESGEPIERFFFDIDANDLETNSYTLNLLDYERGSDSCTLGVYLHDLNGPCSGRASIYDQQTGALVEETSRYGVGDDGFEQWQVPAGTYTIKYIYDTPSPQTCVLTRGFGLIDGETDADTVTFDNGTIWVDLRDLNGSAEGRLWIYNSSGELLTADDGYPLLAANDHTFNLMPDTFSFRYQYVDPNSIAVGPIVANIHLSSGERKQERETVAQGQVTLSTFDTAGPVPSNLGLFVYVPESAGYKDFASLFRKDKKSAEAPNLGNLPLGQSSYVLLVGQYDAELTYNGFDGPAFVQRLASPFAVNSGQNLDRDIVVDTANINARIENNNGSCNGDVTVFDENLGKWVASTPEYGVGDDGKRTLTVPPGEYRLQFTAGTDAQDSRTERLVSLSAGDSTTVAKTFIQNQIEVNVTKNGTPFSSARAYLFEENGFYLGRKNEGSLGASGRVSFYPAPGTYYLMTEDFAQGPLNLETLFVPQTGSFTVSQAELAQISVDTATTQRSVRESGGSATVEIAFALAYPSLVDMTEGRDGEADVLFCVCAVQRDGHQNITSVEANLLPIGGEVKTVLYDDGTHGDLRAGDFIYSTYLPVSYSGQGVVELSVHACDSGANVADSTIEMLFVGSGSDRIPPAKVEDLFAQRDTDDPTICDISWTAAGDDGKTGTATRYELRYSIEPFEASGFSGATLYSPSTAWVPLEAGVKEQKSVTGLDAQKTYYFALKVFDDLDNASAMSNLASTEAPSDDVPPATIDDLFAVSGPLEGQITLSFTAPGDDGTVGTVVGYELRYSESFINEANWDAAEVHAPSHDWVPKTAGSQESWVISTFESSTAYYFAVISLDDASNWSNVSNCASAGGGQDRVPPARINDLAAEESQVEGELILSWTATGDDGDLGVATRYILKYALFEITAANWAFVETFQPSLAWPPLPSGEQELKTISGLLSGRAYYLALKAFDDSSNESDVSNSASAMSGQDTVPPSSIRDLSATPGENSVTLRFTATGDNGIEGEASSYELRYSSSMITSENFPSATLYQPSLAWVPQPAGSLETFAVSNLTANRVLYFAIKAIDEAQNASRISNVASATPTGESVPPSPIFDLSARKWLNTGEILLRFTATGDNGRFGTASDYELRFADAPINETNWPAATVYADSTSWTPQISGAAEHFVISGFSPGSYYYFAIKAIDDSANWSQVSNCVGTYPSDGAPTAAILANGEDFYAGDRLTASFYCYNPGEPLDVDLYALIVLPDGGILSLPAFDTQLAPLEFRPLPGHFCPNAITFIDVVLDGSLAPGTYTFYTAFCWPGSMSPVTDVWATPLHLH